MPTFVIQQADSKKRRIDNAKRGLQNATTAYAEQQTMCGPGQPGVYKQGYAPMIVAMGGQHDTLETYSVNTAQT